MYVDAAAPSGGNGQIASPFRIVAEAVDAAPDGGAVLLADGDYEVVASPRHRIFIRGRCAERVQLRPPRGAANTLLFDLDGREARLDLAGVRLRVDDGTAVRATGHSFVRVHHARVHIGRGYLVTTTDAVSDVEEVLHENEPTSEFSTLVQNLRGSSRIHRTSTRGTRAGAYINHHIPSRVLFSDSVVESSGIAFRSFPTSEARIERVVLHGSAGESVIGWGGGSLFADDLSLRGGISIGAGVLVANRVRIDDGTLEVRNRGAASRVEDLSVRWSDAAVRPGGHCMTAFLGGSSFASRARLYDCVEGGAYAYATGHIELWDSLVRAPRTDPDGFLGVGVQAAVAGDIHLERTVIEGARMAGGVAIHLSAPVLARLPLAHLSPDFGPQIQSTPSRISFEDLVIQNTRNQAGRVSVGLAASANSVVDGRRLAMLGQEGAALIASDTGFDRDYFVAGVSRTLHWDRATELLFNGILPDYLDSPSRLSVHDLFVGPIRRSPILYDPKTRATRPDVLGAFGAFASVGCSIEIEGGFFDGMNVTESALVSQGRISMVRGRLAGSTGCAARRNASTNASVEIESVDIGDNFRNDTCIDGLIPTIRVPMSPN